MFICNIFSWHYITFSLGLNKQSIKLVAVWCGRYAEDAEKLIATLSSKETPNNWQCVRHLLEFLGQLICLSPAVISLSTQLTRAVLPWLRVTGVAQSALTLLSTILRQAKTTNNDQYKTVSSCIQNNLEVRIDLTKWDVPIWDLSGGG